MMVLHQSLVAELCIRMLGWEAGPWWRLGWCIAVDRVPAWWEWTYQWSAGIPFFFHALSFPKIPGKAQTISRDALHLDTGKFLGFVFIGLAHPSITPCLSPPWTPIGVLCYRSVNCKCRCLPLGKSYPSSYSLKVICSLLPPYFCSLSSFLKLFPSGHSGLPNSLKFYLLHQIHPAGSCLILVPLPQISTPQQACTRGLATSYTLTCTHFFFLSFKAEKFQTQSRGKWLNEQLLSILLITQGKCIRHSLHSLNGLISNRRDRPVTRKLKCSDMNVIIGMCTKS